ncbi:carbohydrate binding family 9 domain-containing protein [bacterium]|nr:carbohydrate binding family 9 domain-containing protein [bacterium]MCI0603004.1 carbohydrate binding family 9 domain-containing protein [bacterium]
MLRIGLALVSAILLVQPVLSEAIEKSSKRKFWINSSGTNEIKIDGVLDETEWNQATVISLPYEVRPAENIEARVKTECYLTYDRSHLYVGCIAFDPDPDSIRGRYSDRDRISADDHVGIVLDTFNDERRAFKFFVNPVGVQLDQFQDEVSSTERNSFDAIWDSAGKITADGYVIEMAIPFRSIRFPNTPGQQTWGFDLVRIYPRERRYTFALNPQDRNLACSLCQVSKITGFEGITPGNNIELDPTLTASRQERKLDLSIDDFDGATSTDAGLSAIWGLAPNWTLNATANPDFSNVEADVARLDVNKQFSLSFPERRSFFLEGDDLFDTPIEIVFTRNIADPVAGVKLTGKSGGNAAGFLTAYDEITNLLLPGPRGSSTTSLNEESIDSIFRYRRDIGTDSAVGFLFTDREGTDYYNRVFNVDAKLRISASNTIRLQLLGSQTDYPDVVVQRFSQPDGSFSDRAFQAAFSHSSRNWFFSAQYRDVGADFRADMGFVPRVDLRSSFASLGYRFVPEKDDWFTSLSISVDGHYRTDQAGNLLEEGGQATFEYGGPLQSLISISPGMSRRVFGTQTFDEIFINTTFQINPKKDIFLFFFSTFGNEMDFVNLRKGDIVRLAPDVQYRIGRHVFIDLSHTYERLEIENETLFTANLTQLRLLYNVNRRLFFRVVLQYTDLEQNEDLYTIPVEPLTKTLFSQLLATYKINPRTVLFIGYSDNHLETITIPRTQTQRTFFFKVGYALQL